MMEKKNYFVFVQQFLDLVFPKELLFIIYLFSTKKKVLRNNTFKYPSNLEEEVSFFAEVPSL